MLRVLSSRSIVASAIFIVLACGGSDGSSNNGRIPPRGLVELATNQVPTPTEAPTAVPDIGMPSQSPWQEMAIIVHEARATATKSVHGFHVRVLNGLGIEPTSWNVVFMEEWARNESTTADHNPLATTMGPGACFNSVCVRSYPDEAAGIDATVRTIQLGYYTAILASLRASAMMPGVARELRVWGTVHLAAKIDRGWLPLDD